MRKLFLIATLLLVSSFKYPAKEKKVVYYGSLPLITVTAKSDNTIVKDLEHAIKQINTNTLRIIGEDDLVKQITNFIPKFKGSKRKFRKGQMQNYIAIVRLQPVWEYLELKYSIPKFISISFWIIETGWGKARGFRDHNNLGFVKWTGHGSYFKEYDDCGSDKCKYRSYDTLLEGVDDWAKILLQQRYLKHLYNMNDYHVWVKAYEKGGYWTSKNGYKNRVKMIKKLKLDELKTQYIIKCLTKEG